METTNQSIKIIRDTRQAPSNIIFNGKGAPNTKKRKFTKQSNDTVDLPDSNDINGLTKKQRNFVTEYVKDWNATQAAIRAGYSEKTAFQIGYENLSKPDILSAIDEHEKGLATRFSNDKNRIMKEMSLIAYSDLADYVSELRQLPKQITRAIRKFKVNTTTKILAKDNAFGGKAGDKTITQNMEIELYDKRGALELMGKEINMFKEKRQLVGEDGEDFVFRVLFEDKKVIQKDAAD